MILAFTYDATNVAGLERGSSDDLLMGLPVVALGHDVATRYAGMVLTMLGAEVHEIDAWGPSAESLTPVWAAGKTPVRVSDRGELPSMLDDLRPAGMILGCEPDGRPITDASAKPARIPLIRITPFDSTGPWAGLRGGDLIATAAGGMSIVLGSPGRPPLRVPFEQAEKQAGLTAASLMIAAVRTGRPTETTVAMTDVVAFYARTIGQLYRDLDLPWQREGARSAGCAGWYPYSLLPAADGSMALICRSGAQWRSFVEVMGHPEWADDPRYRSRARIAREYPDEVDALIAPWLSERSREDITAACQAAGVPFLPVFTLEEAARNDAPRRRNSAWGAYLDGAMCRPPAPAVVWRSPKASGVTPRPVASKKAGPLAGLRVVDFGWVGVGPHVALLLGDLGATVVKVESSKRMDYNRLVPIADPERYGTEVGVPRHDAVPFFHAFNRGKLSVDLALGHPEANRVLRPLARWADIVIENFTAGVLARAVLPPARLLELNPRLVIVSLSVAGQESPITRGFAPTVLAAGGLQSVIGYDGEEPLGDLTYGLADYNGAQQGLLLTLAALRQAETTGRGAYVDVSQIEGVLLLAAEELSGAAVDGRPGTRGNRRPGHVPHGTYPTAEPDGWLAIDVPDDATWARLARCMDDNWVADDQWRTYAGRLSGVTELDERIAAWSRRLPAWEAMSILQTAGVPAFPVLGLDDLDARRHGGLAASEVDAGTLGRFPIPVAPWRTNGKRPAPMAAGPALGGDSSFILTEICKFSEAEVAELEREGIVRNACIQSIR